MQTWTIAVRTDIATEQGSRVSRGVCVCMCMHTLIFGKPKGQSDASSQ